MSSLERTKQGRFKIEDAYTIEDIESNRYKSLKITDIFNYPVISLNEEEYFRVKNGNTITLDNDEDKVILTYNNEEIAIYEKDNDIYKCHIMIKHQ